MAKTWSLDGIELLQKIPEEIRDAELRDLESLCQHDTYDKGAEIISSGKSSREVVFILTGSVEIVNFSLTGRPVTLDVVHRGGYCGELAALDGLDRSASVRVVEDGTEVAFLPHKRFNQLLADHSDVAKKIMDRLASIVRWETSRIMELSYIEWWRNLIRTTLTKTPTLFVGLLYLYVSVVGIIFNLFLFWGLGSNVIAYYDITDFLLSGLKEPVAIVIPVLAFVAALILLWLPRWLGFKGFKKVIPSSRFIQNILTVILYIVASFAFVGILGVDEADRISGNQDTIIFYRNDKEISVVLAKYNETPPELTNLREVTSTQDFLFAFDTREKVMRVIPLSSIARIDTIEPIQNGEKEKETEK